MSNRVVVPAHQAGNPFLGSLKGLHIRAPYPDSGSASLKNKIRIFLYPQHSSMLLEFHVVSGGGIAGVHPLSKYTNTAVCFLNFTWFQEAELLEFTQKLTDKNVNLQSEFSSVELRKEGATFRISY
jgi:hypothetical protein